MNSISFLDGRFPARPSRGRLLLWIIAFVCLPDGVRADLRLTFNVVLETDTPANTVPRSEVSRPTREFALMVVLGDDYFTSVGDNTTSLIDFSGRKIYHLNPRDKSYLTFSLYSVLGFREAEIRNRLMLRRVLAAGGLKDNPFETILTEHLFSLRAPDAPPLPTTGPADALAYAQDGKPLFACSAAGTPVSATEAKHFVRFLRYAYAMHPDILNALEERRRIPAEFDLRHYNVKTEHYRFRLVNAEPVARGWEPDKAMAGMKLRESEVDPLCVPANAISQQEFARRCAGLVQAAVKASEARRYLDSLLLFLEYTISSGQPLPKEWGVHLEKIRNDPEARGFLGALQPRGKEAAQKAAEAMRLLQAQTPEGLPVLKVHEANFLTAAGKPEEAQRLFREVLQQSPAMAGAWKDLGDLYYRSYQMELAWQCWDTGRRLHPDHNLFKSVGELERRLVVEHPEYFEAELARPARIDGIPASTSPRGPVAPEKAAGTAAPARGPANSTAKAPATAAGYNSRGIFKQMNGDFGGAIRDYDQAVRIDPTYAVAWINRANARHAQGDFEAALSDYNRGIALAKDHAPYARLFRCLIQRRLKRGDPDAELSRDAAQWASPWTKTVARFLTGQMTEADLYAAAARGAGETTPWLPCEAYYFAGMQALLSGEVERARGLFEKCVGTNKTGRVALVLARAELARLPAKAAASAVDASWAVVYSNSSNERFQRGDLAGAIADCNRALALDSACALAYCNRGAAKGAGGDHAGAIDDYSKRPISIAATTEGPWGIGSEPSTILTVRSNCRPHDRRNVREVHCIDHEQNHENFPLGSRRVTSALLGAGGRQVDAILRTHQLRAKASSGAKSPVSARRIAAM